MTSNDTSIDSSEEPAFVPVNGPTLDSNEEKKTRHHLRGWLSYAFASEVFVVVSLTLFLPICLEQFARDNGYLLPDKTSPCSTAKIAPLNTRDPIEENRCVVKIGWIWVDSASFSLYVYSISVALQALTVISMGGIADHPPHRKLSLLLFATLGSASAMLFLALPSSSPLWPLAALFAIVANVGFGASVVAMNAYLPTLAMEDKEVVAALEKLRFSEEQEQEQGQERNEPGPQEQEEQLEEQTAEISDSNEEPLLLNQRISSPAVQALREEYTSLVSQTTARISGSGIALGYFAGIVALIITLVPVTLMKGSTFSLRLAIFASGFWWALFTIPAVVWLPGASYSNFDIKSPDYSFTTAESSFSIWREIKHAWARLFHMLHWREITRLKHTFLFLAAWFLLSDGFSSITSTALLFGKTQLHMSSSSLIVVGLLVNTAGILGALIWPKIQRWVGWSNKRVLIVLVCLCSFIPLYGCLGFLPFFHSPSSLSPTTSLTVPRFSFGGLTTAGEMYVLAVYFGTVYGAFQAYARAFYSTLIPSSHSARFYALYSITDKSSSFFGPMVVGLIADTTGNIRYAFFFLLGMVWCAVPILYAVSAEKGREDAERYTRRRA